MKDPLEEEYLSSDIVKDVFDILAEGSRDYVMRNFDANRQQSLVDRLCLSIHAGIIKPLDMESLIGRIHTVDTISDVLHIMLEAAHSCGLETVRFYRYTGSHSEERLVSVSCVGHKKYTSRLFEAGCILRRQQLDDSQSVISKSFLCFRNECPTIFKVQKPSETRKTTFVQGIPVLSVDADDCTSDLAGDKSDVWVDFPLVAAGTIIGKFSCDLADSFLGTSVIDRILEFGKLASIAAPILENIGRREIKDVFDLVSRQIQGISVEQELLDYCVYRIPDLLPCDSASVFLSCHDSLGNKKLVLQASSFSPNSASVGKDYYLVEDSGLTPWVARNQKTMCLQDLGDEACRIQQLQAYGIPAPEWNNKISDSISHKGFLAVPIQLGDVVGVFRLIRTGMTGGIEFFPERDIRLVERIIDECICPQLRKIREQSAAHVTIEAVRSLGKADVRFTGQRICNNSSLHQAIWSILRGSIGRHAVAFNRITPDRKAFIHEFFLGDLHAAKCDQYLLDGTLTKFALRSPERSISLCDLTKAEKEGFCRRICPDAVSAMASRVEMFGHLLGVLVVLSDAYDLDRAVLGPGLEVISHNLGISVVSEYLQEFSDLLSQGLDALNIDGYIPNVPRSTSICEYDVRYAAELGAIAAGVKAGRINRFLNRLPSINMNQDKVASVSAVVYNLLRQAWSSSQSVVPTVTVRGDARRLKDNNPWFLLRIDGLLCGMKPSDAKDAFAALESSGSQSINNSRALGITCARQLVQSCHSRDGTPGKLKMNVSPDRSSCSVLAKIPL